MMMKKWVALLMAAVLCLAMTACGEPDPAKEAARVVVSVGDTKVTKGEALPIYDAMVKMESYYQLQTTGTALDLTNAQTVASLKENVLNILGEQAVYEETLSDAGKPLTQADLDQISADAQAQHVEMIQAYAETNGLETDAAKAAADEQGYTLDYMRFTLRANLVAERLVELANLNLEVTEEEIAQHYQELSTAAVDTYAATPSSYATDVTNGETIYARPEGFRNIKNLVISMTEEMRTAISAKGSEQYTASYMALLMQNQLAATDLAEETRTDYETQLATYEADAARLEEEMAQLVADGQEEIREHAEAVLALAKADGADFDALLAEYGTDPASDGTDPAANPVILENGYPVAAGISTYVASFTEGAMALTAVGDISDLIPSDYGFHILKYQSDVTPGVVPLEELHDEIKAHILEEEESAAMTTYKQELITRTPPRLYISRL